MSKKTYLYDKDGKYAGMASDEIPVVTLGPDALADILVIPFLLLISPALWLWFVRPEASWLELAVVGVVAAVVFGGGVFIFLRSRKRPAIYDELDRLTESNSKLMQENRDIQKRNEQILREIALKETELLTAINDLPIFNTLTTRKAPELLRLHTPDYQKFFAIAIELAEAEEKGDSLVQPYECLSKLSDIALALGFYIDDNRPEGYEGYVSRLNSFRSFLADCDNKTMKVLDKNITAAEVKDWIQKSQDLFRLADELSIHQPQ